MDSLEQMRSCREDIPKDFPGILRDLTREILLAQPKSAREIYKFAAAYFEVKCQSSVVLGGEVYTFDDKALITHFLEKFKNADKGSGLLDRESFKSVMNNLELELSEDQVMLLYMEAQPTTDFKFPSEAIIPRIAAITKEVMVKKQQGFDTKLDSMGETDYILCGISKVELDEALRSHFQDYDKDRSGHLHLRDLQDFLRSSQLQLSQKCINMLTMVAPAGPDGRIPFDVFAPTFHHALFVFVASDVGQWMREEIAADLPDRLLAACASLDSVGTGRLAPHQLAAAIRAADVGVSHFHIISVVGEARAEPAGSDGQGGVAVDYGPFVAEHAAPILSKLLREDTSPVPAGEGLSAVQLRAAERAAELALGAARGESVAAVERVLAAADAEGRGRLSTGALRRALEQSALGFTDRQVIMALGMVDDVDGEGKAAYAGLGARLLDMILWEARLERVYDAMEQGAAAAAAEADADAGA